MSLLRGFLPIKDKDDEVYVPDPLGRVGRGRRVPRRDPFGRVMPDRDFEDFRKAWRSGADLGDLFAGDPFALGRPVGTGGDNRRADVARVETALGRTGHLDLSRTDGPTGYPGSRLVDATKRFQKENGLEVDGVIRPGGETIAALARRLAARAPAAGPAAPSTRPAARMPRAVTGTGTTPPAIRRMAETLRAWDRDGIDWRNGEAPGNRNATMRRAAETRGASQPSRPAAGRNPEGQAPIPAPRPDGPSGAPGDPGDGSGRRQGSAGPDRTGVDAETAARNADRAERIVREGRLDDDLARRLDAALMDGSAEDRRELADLILVIRERDADLADDLASRTLAAAGISVGEDGALRDSAGRRLPARPGDPREGERDDETRGPRPGERQVAVAPAVAAAILLTGGITAIAAGDYLRREYQRLRREGWPLGRGPDKPAPRKPDRTAGMHGRTDIVDDMPTNPPGFPSEGPFTNDETRPHGRPAEHGDFSEGREADKLPSPSLEARREAIREDFVKEMLKPLQSHPGDEFTRRGNDIAARECRIVLREDYPDLEPLIEHVGGATKDGKGKEGLSEKYIERKGRTKPGDHQGSSHPDLSWRRKDLDTNHPEAHSHANTQTHGKRDYPLAHERRSLARLARNVGEKLVIGMPKLRPGMDEDEYAKRVKAKCRELFRNWLGGPTGEHQKGTPDGG